MLARLSFLSYFTESTVWIVGDSIVFWAQRRSERTGLADLGLGTALHWAGKRGLRLNEASSWLEKKARGKPKPTVVVFHVGTNDLEDNSKRTLAGAVHRLYESHSGVEIVWSDILERVAYNHCRPEDQGKLDGRRRSTNRYAHALSRRQGGKAISHPSINHQNATLFRPDGLHLSNEGLDQFISDLKIGLSYLSHCT